MSEIRIEHNVATGEILEIELTDKEIKDIQKLRIDAEKANKIAEAAKVKSNAEKAALLARLGISADEAKLLLGGSN